MRAAYLPRNLLRPEEHGYVRAPFYAEEGVGFYAGRHGSPAADQ